MTDIRAALAELVAAEESPDSSSWKLERRLAIANRKRLAMDAARAALAAQPEQPLKDEQIDKLWHEAAAPARTTRSLYTAFARSVERAVGGKPAQTRSERLADAGFTRRPSLHAMGMREALELIANDESSPRAMRIALEALGRDEE